MMHHHSSLGKTVCFLTSLLLSLTAIAVGLLAFGYDVLALPVVQTHLSSVVYPLKIVIGVVGVIGLFFTLFGGVIADRCECCSKHDATHNRGNH